MHDIKALRENPEAYVRGWSSRGRDSAQSDVDALIALDKDLRAAKTAFETNQAQLKKLSGEIGKAKAQKDEAKASELMAEVEALKGAIAAAQEQERVKEAELRDALAALPNVPFEDVPQGADEHGNVEVRKHGAPNILTFTAKDHADLGEALGFMDFEAAAKMSGSRFVVLKGQLARLERAIGQWMLDTQTTADDRARLYRGQPAGSGAWRCFVRDWPVAEVRGRPLQDDGRSLPDPDRRSDADQPGPRSHHG
jgi:seryl-tRNA synthetase